MKFTAKLCCLGLGAALLAGCGKKEEAASTEGASGAPAASSAPSAAPTPTPVPTPTAPPKPVTNDADANAIRGCCSAIRKAADAEKNAVNKGKLTSAASVCDAQANNVKTGSLSRSGALSSIRASMGGKPLPAGCN